LPVATTTIAVSVQMKRSKEQNLDIDQPLAIGMLCTTVDTVSMLFFFSGEEDDETRD
jgi:hypothetical protein